MSLLVWLPLNGSLENKGLTNTKFNVYNSETEESFEKRFKTAKDELSRANEYDYIVINDDINLCAEQIVKILESEKLRYCRMENIVKNIIEE